MITFLCSIALLIVSYFTYAKYIERLFGVKPERRTPAYTLADNVDYVPMGRNRNSLIQLLNIAGVGPIFGPIMGALYGPVAFVWIVLGAIFAGAVHDYLTGMISLRNRGAHLPELAGKFLGRIYRHVVNGFALLLLLLVATVFVTAPADLLASISPAWMTAGVWVVAIFVYYLVATIFPVHMVIGRLYPFFGALLLASAFGIGGVLIADDHPIPELTLANLHPTGLAIFPMLFLTISCGALSGFHATQSPIISRTTQNETQGRFIFYGMMITEAVIAMIWAAAAMTVFSGQSLNAMLSESGPAGVVKHVSLSALGAFAGTIAVIGVIILPITSGDTAFRSARMIIADYFGLAQRKLGTRLAVTIPMFMISIILTRMDFGVLWRYFSWANQSLAMIALWIGAMYLGLQRKNMWVAVVPAIFITATTFTYILNAEIGLNLPMHWAYAGAAVITAMIIAGFFRALKTRLQNADNGIEISLDDGLDEQVDADPEPPTEPVTV